MTQNTNHPILTTLAKVFPKEPVFITDSAELTDYLNSQRLKSFLLSPATISELDKQMLENIVLLFTTFDYFSWPFLEKHFGLTRLFMIPLVSFDPSLEAAIYTLRRIGEADFVSATSENRNILHFLSTVSDRFSVLGSGCALECKLSEKIRLMKPKVEAGLLPGEWEAVGMWFETAMLPDEEDVFHPGHIVSGTFQAAGAAVAKHRQMPSQLVHHHSDAWQLLYALHEEKEFPLRVDIEKSQVIDVLTASGESIRPQLLTMTNERHDLMLLEVAFSGNSKLSVDTIKWGINSVVNEGAKGMHIGIGDGITGAHIDLIAPNALIVPA